MIDQPRSSQRFEAKPRTDEAPLVMRMLQLARAKPRYGYRRIGWSLREEGWRAGLSRVFRLWQREGLKVPVKKRKKRRLGSSVNGCHRRRAEAPNDVWCWDFVFDRTASGSQLKWLSVVDEYTRECLALKVDRGITSEDVIDTLSELFAMRGVPRHIRSDNGPEFIAQTLRRWLKQVGIGTEGIRLRGHREQVNASLAVIPVTKLLRQHVEIVAEHIYLSPQKPLQVCTFPDSHLRQRRLGNGAKGLIRDLIERHGRCSVGC